MTKFKINVTKEVLERSANCSSKRLGLNCAIAIAINDLFPASWVTREKILFADSLESIENYMENPKHLYFEIADTKLPIIATSFIDIFDNCYPQDRLLMEPFSFEIDVPDVIIDKISIDEIKKVLETSTTMELINC